MKKIFLTLAILFLSLYSFNAAFAGGGVVAGDGYPGIGQRVNEQKQIPFPVDQALLTSKLEKLVQYFPLLSVKMKQVIDNFSSGQFLSYRVSDKASHPAGFEVLYSGSSTIEWGALYFWEPFFSLPLETSNPEADSQLKVIFHELLHLTNTFDHELTTQRLDTLLMTILYSPSPSIGVVEEFRRNLHPQNRIMDSSYNDFEAYAALMKLNKPCDDFEKVILSPFQISHQRTPAYFTQEAFNKDSLLRAYWRSCFGKTGYNFNYKSTNTESFIDDESFIQTSFQNPELSKKLFLELLEYVFETVDVTITLNVGPIPQKTIQHPGHTFPFWKFWAKNSQGWEETIPLYHESTLFISEIEAHLTPYQPIRFSLDEVAQSKETVAQLSDLAHHIRENLRDNRALYGNRLFLKTIASINNIFEYFLFKQEGAALSFLPNLSFRPNIHFELSSSIKEKFKSLSCHYYEEGQYQCDATTLDNQTISIPFLSAVQYQFVTSDQAQSLGLHIYPHFLMDLNDQTRQTYYDVPYLKKPALYDYFSHLFGTDKWATLKPDDWRFDHRIKEVFPQNYDYYQSLMENWFSFSGQLGWGGQKARNRYFYPSEILLHW